MTQPPTPANLQDWVGRTQTTHDLLSPVQARQMAALPVCQPPGPAAGDLGGIRGRAERIQTFDNTGRKAGQVPLVAIGRQGDEPAHG